MRDAVSDDDSSRAVEDWHRFSTLARMVNHWDRPGWDSGRSAYYWYFTFNDFALSTFAQQHQERLAGLGLDLVGPEWLHLSLDRLAWTDEISHEDAKRAADEAQCRLEGTSRFALQIGPLAGSAGAVRFSVEPWEPIETIRSLLAAINPTDCTATPRTFLPHITIAYNNHDRLARPVIDVVAQTRSHPAISVEVTQVGLVAVRRDGHAYKWETVRQIALGGRSSAR
jgi:2'-5' RNA ligase